MDDPGQEGYCYITKGYGANRGISYVYVGN